METQAAITFILKSNSKCGCLCLYQKLEQLFLLCKVGRDAGKYHLMEHWIICTGMALTAEGCKKNISLSRKSKRTAHGNYSRGLTWKLTCFWKQAYICIFDQFCRWSAWTFFGPSVGPHFPSTVQRQEGTAGKLYTFVTLKQSCSFRVSQNVS